MGTDIIGPGKLHDKMVQKIIKELKFFKQETYTNEHLFDDVGQCR